MPYYLPSKIPKHLLRLSHNYGSNDRKPELKALLESAKVAILEAIEYDNYNGGMEGHGVIVFVPLEVLASISPKEQSTLTESLLKDLRLICGTIPGEFIADLRFEPNDEDDKEFQNASSILKRPSVDPDRLNIWQPDRIRVFISHRDKYKTEANELATYLDSYGFSSFVAHDTITPMSEWRVEIMRGLQTMEIFLVFLTDDFEDSIWTNQEVGFALGDDKPIVTLKLGRKDPPGFISHVQALKGNLENLNDATLRLVPLLTQATRSKERIQTSLVKAFVESPDWGETGKRFNRMSQLVGTLTEFELKLIQEGFTKNDQLHNASVLTNSNGRLAKFLKKTTNRSFRIEGTKLIDETPDEDPIPF